MSRKYRISQVCGAKRRQGGFCRKAVASGKNRCFRHGGATTRHKTEDEHHSRSLAAANAARAAMTRPHRTDGRRGGLVRAATGARLPNGRFAPNARPVPKRDRIVAKALARVIAMQKDRRVAREASLRVVPDDPGVDQPRAAAPEFGTTAIKPEAAASASGTLALPENSGEAKELLEDFPGTLLTTPSPFHEADEDVSLWEVVADELPDELFDHLTRWLDANM